MSEPATSARLTPRESEVASLLLAGCERESIAGRLKINQPVAATHLLNIRKKLGADTHSAMMARLREITRTPDKTIEEARRNPRTWCDI